MNQPKIKTVNLVPPSLIGSRLRMEMKKRGITSAELAKRADVKTSFLYDIISGKSANPSTVKLARVADELGISLSYLAGSTDTPTAHSIAQNFQEDYITVPRIAVDMSAMGGTVVSQEEEGERYFFRREWISRHLGVTPKDLRLLYIRGDSMEPNLCHNDIVLVDTTQKSPSPPGIFVLFDGFGLVAKRLEYISGSSPDRVKIIPDNPHYTHYERLLDETVIIGRIVWFAREI